MHMRIAITRRPPDHPGAALAGKRRLVNTAHGAIVVTVAGSILLTLSCLPASAGLCRPPAPDPFPCGPRPPPRRSAHRTTPTQCPRQPLRRPFRSHGPVGHDRAHDHAARANPRTPAPRSRDDLVKHVLSSCRADPFDGQVPRRCIISERNLLL